ncbi:MAG: protein BatD, partial [Myxococcales bacterium]|nr:protein BatD [Myxococcales bacterium]
VTVGNSGAAPPPPPPAAGPANPPAGGAPDEAPADLAGKPFFVQAVVKPTDPVVGGQVIVEYYLYVRDDVDAEKYELNTLPDFIGFTQHELPTSTTLNFTQQAVNGRLYQTALVKRFAIFPTAGGEQTIGALGLRIQYVRHGNSRRRSRDPFDGMFPSFFRERDVAEAQSVPVKINVRPLPAENQPADFAGAVGRMQVKAELDRTETPVGEPFTLKLVVAGEGNVETVRRPTLPLDANLRVYSEKDHAEMTPNFDKVTGEKTFEEILIAAAPGEYEIPPIRLPYFDPVAKQYQEAASAPLRIKVTGEAQQGNARQLTTLTREAVELRGKDLRYIRRDKNDVRLRRAALAASPVVWGLLALWPLLVLAVIGGQIRRGRLRADRRTYRSRRAMKEAKARLKAAQELMADADPTRFHAELHRAVIGFVADKLDAAAPGLDRAALLSSLRAKGAPPEPLEWLDQLWREADAVRFGGLATDAGTRQAALDKARRLLERLGEELES